MRVEIHAKRVLCVTCEWHIDGGSYKLFQQVSVDTYAQAARLSCERPSKSDSALIKKGAPLGIHVIPLGIPTPIRKI